MKYDVKTWPIRRLVQLYEDGRLELSPPYQRNPIWPIKAQQRLIDTIEKGQPIPNLFLRQLDEKMFEIVDGQQRARTIITFHRGMLADFQGITLDPTADLPPEVKRLREHFLAYSLIIVTISDLGERESIEGFYTLVNSTGLRLNRPELKKAQYYNTNFLKLMTCCAESEAFLDLLLFTPSHLRRMEHVDFVSELLALIKFGITDKKGKVDDMFEPDISEEEAGTLGQRFYEIISHFIRFNSSVPLYRTRYRQKNDFYTLFSFIGNHPDLDDTALDYYYEILLKLAVHIRPSQEECDPLMEYAYHCVTQSNSKIARERRLEILEQLFLNPTSTPNDTQQQILKYFSASDRPLVKKSRYWTVERDVLVDANKPEFGL